MKGMKGKKSEVWRSALRKTKHRFPSPPMRVIGVTRLVWIGKQLWRDASKADLVKNPQGKWQTIWSTQFATSLEAARKQMSKIT